MPQNIRLQEQVGSDINHQTNPDSHHISVSSIAELIALQHKSLPSVKPMGRG